MFKNTNEAIKAGLKSTVEDRFFWNQERGNYHILALQALENEDYGLAAYYASQALFFAQARDALRLQAMDET